MSPEFTQQFYIKKEKLVWWHEIIHHLESMVKEQYHATRGSKETKGNLYMATFCQPFKGMFRVTHWGTHNYQDMDFTFSRSIIWVEIISCHFPAFCMTKKGGFRILERGLFLRKHIYAMLLNDLCPTRYSRNFEHLEFGTQAWYIWASDEDQETSPWPTFEPKWPSQWEGCLFLTFIFIGLYGRGLRSLRSLLGKVPKALFKRPAALLRW